MQHDLLKPLQSNRTDASNMLVALLEKYFSKNIGKQSSPLGDTASIYCFHILINSLLAQYSSFSLKSIFPCSYAICFEMRGGHPLLALEVGM